VVEDSEEDSEVVEVVETIRMDIVVVMVVTMVATEEVVVATMTAVVMDTEAKEVVVVASEVKMDQAEDLEVDVVVNEVTVVMDIAEGSREAADNSINNNHIKCKEIIPITGGYCDTTVGTYYFCDARDTLSERNKITLCGYK